MRPGSTCVRSLSAGMFLAALTLVALPVRAADDASVGYETIRPSLVKVWAFDRAGRPTESGTGIIVDSSDHRSHVLTATHVVAGAASIRIDVNRDAHDLSARVERTGPRDLTLLAVDRGGLHAARFAPRSRAVVEGNLVAVAGYVKNDELIGVVGQEPRVLFPGTVSSRPENGLYLELENVHIEEGLSGGAVFDPATGAILGVITSRTSDRRGGFADSAALVVEPFLAANNVAVAVPPPAATAVPAVHVAATAAPRALALPSLRPVPVATLQAVVALSVPRDSGAGIFAWQSTGAQPKRFVFVRDGCRVALTVDISTLQFVIAHAALVQPQHHGALLGVTIQQRAANNDGCAPGGDPSEGSYDATAMSFDGHHVTMRLAFYSGEKGNGSFPSDASLDANIDGDSATATVQLFDRDWSGVIELPLARTPLASISSSW